MDRAEPSERFTGLSTPYAQGRPDYPMETIRWCVGQLDAPPNLIVDVGCGTGISTRAFAALGHRVVGIDPNVDMLTTATGQGSAEYLAGTSTGTGLPDACADLIVAAQAFHWFEFPATLREFARIGREHAVCAAFWNIRSTDSPFASGYEELLRRHSTEYEANDRALRTIARLKEILGGKVQEHNVQHGIRMDLDRLRALAMSSSYVKHGVSDMPAFTAELDMLFHANADRGAVEMRYTTAALAWRAHAPIVGH
jgi:ubiquinone/menaquinone biosynthesis C-methylase UbiE